MKTIAVVAPFPNPHFLDIFDSEAFTSHWNVDRFCFRSLPAHRQNYGWEEATFQPLSSSYFRLLPTQRSVLDYEAIVYYGAIDPNCIPAWMMCNSLKHGQRTFLATEGIRFKHPRWRSLGFSFLLNHPKLEFLAIGDGSAEDFRAAGLTKPTYRKYGFFENYAPYQADNLSGDSSRCQILSVGQLIDRKNFLSVVRSLQRLATRIKHPVTYTICGEGSQRPDFEAMIAQLPKNIEVKLMGNCNAKQLDECFRIADIFAMPSTYDGWGVVLNQAIHYQLPVIAASGVRAARDHLVCDNHNGFIYENESELDDRLIKLVQSPELRTRFSDNSADIGKAWHIDTVAANLAKVVAGEEPVIDSPFDPLVRV